MKGCTLRSVVFLAFALLAFCSLQKAVTAQESKSGTQVDPGQTGAQLAAQASTPPAFTPLTGSARFDYYLHHTYGPYAIARSMFWAGINQAVDTPSEWEQGMEGYGRRFGSKFGQHAIKDSVRDALAAMLHEDPRYIPSQRTGFGSRTAYAVKHAFLTYRNDGTTKFGDSRLAGIFAGAFISHYAWYPRREQTVSDGLISGAAAYGFDIGWTVVREFWPDIERRIGRMLH